MYRILIVEDENMIRRYLTAKTDWKSLNCEVVGEAENGKEGLDKIIKLNPDIVLADVRMPLMDGLEMISKAKQMTVFETIIISAFSDFNYAQKAISLGVSEYLLKPINSKKLEDAIRKICTNIQIVHKMHAAELTSIADALDIAYIETIKTKLSSPVILMYQYIQSHYREKIGIIDISEKIGISSTYANRLFKKELSYPFNDFLNRYRIHIAVTIMNTGNHSIFEIAEETGFNDYKYFSSVFHKYLKCSPRDFLKNAAKT